jgi:hypothetical protein
MKQTKHKTDCTRVFKRYDATCERCKELSQGAKPRQWNMSVNYQMRVGKGPAYEAFVRALKAHNCKDSKCGSVCTAFDW